MSEQKVAVDVVMPTWENDVMANDAKQSIVANTDFPIRIFKPVSNMLNKGWMAGCNEGIVDALAKYDSEYILLTNDDILVSPVVDWVSVMVGIMDQHKELGALVPLTMNAMGYSRLTPENSLKSKFSFFRVPYASFCFVLLRKEAVRKAGMLDENLPGGDDLDYCLRLSNSGYIIGVTPKVFVWHHYAQTGKRIYGDYWDSPAHAEKITQALIRKHGFMKFTCMMSGQEEN